MSKFCTQCGKEIADDASFCPECGAQVNVTDNEPQQSQPVQQFQQPEQSYAPNKEPVYDCVNEPQPQAQSNDYSAPQNDFQPQPQPDYHQPPVCNTPVYPYPPFPQGAPNGAPKGGPYGVVSTGGFFGLMLLFALPFIGWIICLIAAFVPQNENIKHYARAMLIWLIIAVVVIVLLAVLLYNVASSGGYNPYL